MTAEPDGTAQGPADPPRPDTGAASGEEASTLQGLLATQVLVSILAIGYGAITGNWSDAWQIIGGCLILAAALSVFFQVRNMVRRRRADRPPGAPRN